MTKKGVTLLELLIGLVIVLILTAIAVQNYNMALIRSNIYKLKADILISAAALEYYYLDHNSYPGALPPGYGWGSNMWSLPIVMTTPITYISTIPSDKFDSFNGSLGKMKYRIAGWGYLSVNGKPSGTPVLGANAIFCVNNNSGNKADDVFYSIREANITKIQYCLFSPGPGQSYLSDNGSNYPQPYRLWYDPTNGSNSLGYIVRQSNGFESPG